MPIYPIKDKIREAAQAYTPLTDLLGTSPFRWWNVQLRAGAAFPAIVVRIINDAPTYANLGPLKASFSRLEFQLWDTNPQRLETLDSALQSFIGQFNGGGLPDSPCPANYVQTGFDREYPDPSPPQYQRFIEVKIFNNPSAP